jgi:glutaredoxin-like YruB-family protein
MQVKLYSTLSCPYCVALKGFLEENKIEFEEIDISQDEESMKMIVEKTGQMGVPVIDIDGELVVGFDRRKIVELLNIK